MIMSRIIMSIIIRPRITRPRAAQAVCPYAYVPADNTATTQAHTVANTRQNQPSIRAAGTQPFLSSPILSHPSSHSVPEDAVTLEPAREGLCMPVVALAEVPASLLSNALDASCLTARCRGAAHTL
jgi:hypothetical protein